MMRLRLWLGGTGLSNSLELVCVEARSHSVGEWASSVLLLSFWLRSSGQSGSSI